MSKKRAVILTGIVICVMISGCGSSAAGRHADGSNSVEAVIEQQMAEADSATTDESVKMVVSPDSVTAAGSLYADSASYDDIEQGKSATDTYSVEDEAAKAAELVRSTEGVDVDLSVLSGNMVYSEVYNIMYYPEEYIGKIIRMRGSCLPFYDEVNDKYYYACLIQDAAACCAQGIEFILNDGYSIPEDYPEEDAEITVTGVFDTYEEDGSIYCTLRDASLG